VNQLLKKLEPLAITPEIQAFTAQKIAALRRSDEGQEGIKAFLEKRKPHWVPVDK